MFSFTIFTSIAVILSSVAIPGDPCQHLRPTILFIFSSRFIVYFLLLRWVHTLYPPSTPSGRLNSIFRISFLLLLTMAPGLFPCTIPRIFCIRLFYTYLTASVCMFMTLASSPIEDIQSCAGLLCFVFEALALCALAGLFVIRAFARDQLQSRLPLRLSFVQYFTVFCFILFCRLVGVIALTLALRESSTCKHYSLG